MDGGVECGGAGQVLAGGEGHGGGFGEGLPFGPGAVGADGFLEPAEAERGHGGGGLVGLGGGPALVGVGHEGGGRAEGSTHGGEVGAVAREAEADLELEGGMPGFAAGEGGGGGVVRADAAGVGGDGCGVAAQDAPEREVAAPGHEVPEGDVDAGDALGERPGLAGLQGEHGGVGGEGGEGFGGAGDGLVFQDGGQDLVDDARPVLGAEGGEIAPDLTPANDAVRILGADEQHGAVGHGAERGDNGGCDRRAVEAGGDGAEADHAVRCHGATTPSPALP